MDEAKYTSVWFTDKDKALLCAIGVATGCKIELYTEAVDAFLYKNKYQVVITKERDEQ